MLLYIIVKTNVHCYITCLQIKKLLFKITKIGEVELNTILKNIRILNSFISIFAIAYLNMSGQHFIILLYIDNILN